MTKTIFSTSKKIERAVLVGLITNEQSEEHVRYLDELEFYPIQRVQRQLAFYQKLDSPNQKHL